MSKLHRLISSAAILCGGAVLLGGCQHQADQAGPSVSASASVPSVQVQKQGIDNDPHIPAAQKAAIDANLGKNPFQVTSPAPASHQ